MKKINFKKTPKEKKPKEKGNKKGIKNKILIALMGLGIAILIALIIFIIYIVIVSPEFTAEKFYNKESSTLYDINGNEFATLGAENRELISYDDLPQVLVDAIIATEDARFFKHSGFDLARFVKASVAQVFGNSGAGGASTLSMQVSKNNLTDKDVSIIRKFTDIYMAVFEIEKKFTKEEIIEFYVNKPYLGNRSYGIEQASWGYFGKSVKDLNLAEAAMLAGMFQAPGAYNPYVYPEKAEARRNTVLELMVKHGFISEDEANFASNIPVESMLIGAESITRNPYQGFIDTVVEEVRKKEGVNPYNTPMNIYTSMDPDRQDVVNQLMNGELYTFINDSIQSAVVITDVKDGSITAVGSGRNKTGELQFNLATMMERHPGSSIKPMMDYGPYLEFNNGSTYTLFFDEPYSYSNGQSIKNSDGSHNGMMTMKVALANSRNIPALQAFQQLNKNDVSAFVHSLGINYGENLYESASIGAFDGVTPLQLSAAYATFARGGYYIEPYSYYKIEFKETGTNVEQKPKREKVMSEETAFMINYILKYAGSIGVGGNISSKFGDFATKGGTTTFDDGALARYNYPSSAAADAWMTAYTSDYSLTVWYGYEKAKEGRYITASGGSTARRKITAEVANRVFKTGSKFPASSGVVQVTVEYETIPAMLPSAHTPDNLKVTEYFRRGTEPTDVSPRFDTLTNAKNGKYTTNGNQIILSWDKVTTPEAIDIANLQRYFNSGYKDFAEKYYNRRINYNNTYIGQFGYDVYQKSPSGSLNYLGWTQNTSYTINLSGDNTFVIKSAYSIFKSNASSGLTISTSNGSTSTGNIRVEVNGSSTVCVPVSGSTSYYSDRSDPIVVTQNSNNVTGQYLWDRSYYRINANNTSTILPAGIDTNQIGTYQIMYTVTLAGTTLNPQYAYRTINVQNTCP